MTRKYILSLLLILFFISCSTPESEGIKAAKKYLTGETAFVEYSEKEYLDLIKKFDTYNFKTHIEAREKIFEISNEAYKILEDITDKADENYQNKKREYATNINKNIEFEHAFQVYREQNSPVHNNIKNLLAQIDSKILTIIPPVPDIDKIKKDLSGHELSEQPNIYFNQNRRWLIESENILNIEILRMTKGIESYFFNTYMKFQSGGSVYEANVDITYILFQNDDWTVDWIGCQNLKIVQTGRYNNYITARITGWPGEYELEFSNNSNIPLLIGGYVYLEFRREWRPFTTVVEAYGKNSVGGLFSGSVTNYEIHFVERP